MKFIKEFKIFEGTEPPIEVGSKWMSKKGWGDIADLYTTEDDDKKAVFTVTRISDKGRRIYYNIKYDGNPKPDELYSSSRSKFLADLKPKFKWEGENNHIIGKRLVKEAYERPKAPGTNTKWIKNGSDEVATVLGAGDKYITYSLNGQRVEGVIANFVKEFTEEAKPAPYVPKDTIYADRLSGEDDLKLDFNKSEYLADEKALIGAYFIISRNEKSIEILNIKEIESNTAVFMDGSMPYRVTFSKVTLPLSQIAIIEEVDGKPGFFYIKLPYWLYQKNKDGLFIKRVSGRKGLDMRDAQLRDKELMAWFKDPNVIKYLSITDSNEDTLRKANLYAKRS